MEQEERIVRYLFFFFFKQKTAYEIQIDAEQVDLKLPAVELCQARRIVVNSHHTGGIGRYRVTQSQRFRVQRQVLGHLRLGTAGKACCDQRSQNASLMTWLSHENLPFP